jgi:hypothetical protein
VTPAYSQYVKEKIPEEEQQILITKRPTAHLTQNFHAKETTKSADPRKTHQSNVKKKRGKKNNTCNPEKTRVVLQHNFSRSRQTTNTEKSRHPHKPHKLF